MINAVVRARATVGPHSGSVPPGPAQLRQGPSSLLSAALGQEFPVVVRDPDELEQGLAGKSDDRLASMGGTQQGYVGYQTNDTRAASLQSYSWALSRSDFLPTLGHRSAAGRAAPLLRWPLLVRSKIRYSFRRMLVQAKGDRLR